MDAGTFLLKLFFVWPIKIVWWVVKEVLLRFIVFIMGIGVVLWLVTNPQIITKIMARF